jgi:hypothetical protein
MAVYSIDIDGIVYTRAPSITSLRKKWRDMLTEMADAEVYAVGDFDWNSPRYTHILGMRRVTIEVAALPAVFEGFSLGTITLRREA